MPTFQQYTNINKINGESQNININTQPRIEKKDSISRTVSMKRE